MLSFSIDKQTLIRLDNQQVVTDSYNYLYAYFNFSSDWNNVNKNAIFEINGKTYTMPILNNISLVPWEVIVVPDFTVSAYGFTTTKRITTNSISVETNSFITEPENIPQNQPTPTDYEAYVELVNEALKQINDLSVEAEQVLDQAKQYNEQSQQAATNAANSASQAEASSQSAQASAQNAESSAQNASNSASSAQNSASEASTYAQNAKESETKAEQYSVSAQNSASEAQQYSSSAQESAEQANQSSESAQQYASNAETSANNAAQSAETAKEYSDNVVSLGTQAVENINSAKDAAIQEITQSKDGALADIDSTQTGAISAISQAQQTAVSDITDKGTEQVNNINSAGSTAISNIQSAESESLQKIQNAQTTAIEDINNTADEKIQEIENINSLLPKPTESDSGKSVVVNSTGDSYELKNIINDTVIAEDTTWSAQKLVDTLCPPFSVTGDVVQFSPVEGYPLSVQSTIVATQSGEGDPSPTNVRPITPVEQVGAWVGGKNVLDFAQLSSYAYWRADLATEGQSSAITTAGNRGFVLPCKPGSVYTISFNSNGGFPTYLYLCKTGSSGAELITYLTKDAIVNNKFSFSLENGETAYLRMGGTGDQSSFEAQINKLLDVQLEVGSAATAYEPYRGQLYTAPLDEPCYGGTVDLTGGTGQFDYFKVEISDPSTVYMSDGNTIFYTTLSVLGFADAKYKPTQNVASAKLFMCDRLKPVQNVSNTSPYGEVAIFNNGIIRMKVDGVTSVQEARDWITANPVTLAYKLATPTPFTIDPLSIPAPASPSTAYSTAGEITVSGRSDPTAFINQQIANAIAIAKV